MLYKLGRVNGIALNHDALRHETSASYATIIKEEECTDQCRDDNVNVKKYFLTFSSHKTYHILYFVFKKSVCISKQVLNQTFDYMTKRMYVLLKSLYS